MNLVASGLGKPKNSRGGEPVISDQCVEGISLCKKLDRTSTLKSNKVHDRHIAGGAVCAST